MLHTKTLFLIAILSVMTLGAFAQTQSQASIEVGYLPESAVFITKPTYLADDFSKLFYANIDVYLAVLRYGYIDGEVDTVFGTCTIPDGFFPVYGSVVASTYKVGAGVVVGGLTVGVEHGCTHPITPDWTTVLYGNASYTKVFAKLTVKF